jgi:RND superfamily putative drug exporter
LQSLQASKRIGKVFHEFDSDSAAMIVLDGDQAVGADAHHYYDGLIRKLSQDTKHVEHIQDFWGEPLTAAGSQSTDGKAALVRVYLAGNQGESLSNESVDSVRNIVDQTPPPPGVKAYVTGAAPLVTDQFEVGVLLPRPRTNRPSAIPWTSAANDASASGERANSGMTLVPTMAFSANR